MKAPIYLHDVDYLLRIVILVRVLQHVYQAACSMAETTRFNESPRCSVSRWFFSVLQSKLTLMRQLSNDVGILATIYPIQNKDEPAAIAICAEQSVFMIPGISLGLSTVSIAP